MTSLLLLLLLGDLASAAELEFEMPAVSMYAQRSVLTGGSLVVIGAHHFGRDANDAIYKSVANVSWSSVLLVEASPIVAAELKTFVAERNPTPSVPHNKVKVVNAGVCPGGSDGTSEQSTLPFREGRELGPAELCRADAQVDVSDETAARMYRKLRRGCDA